MTKAPALHLRDVTKRYVVGDSTITAVDGVDLEVADGELVALVGPSGSGKTTVCSIAGALLTPTSGTVEVAGTDVTGFSTGRLTSFRQTNVGFVFQSVNLIPFLTARENLLVVDELGPRRGRRARARADELLDQLGLTDRARNLPGELSGGQRQRVAIGRALMNDPALVLFDEPTSALDTATGSQVMDLIRQETKARGTAAVVVTHDGRITEWCDRTVQLSDGRVVGQPALTGAATPG